VTHLCLGKPGPAARVVAWLWSLGHPSLPGTATSSASRGPCRSRKSIRKPDWTAA